MKTTGCTEYFGLAAQSDFTPEKGHSKSNRSFVDVQTLKPLQICTGFMFRTFPAMLTPK